MNEVTLQLPKTLYQHLDVLAEREAVPLTQYILYILTRQIVGGGFTVRVVPEEDVVSQTFGGIRTEIEILDTRTEGQECRIGPVIRVGVPGQSHAGAAHPFGPG